MTNVAKGVVLVIGLFQLVSSGSWHTANDGRDYFVETGRGYNWFQAMDECSRRGLHLAVIDSEEKNFGLVRLLGKVFDPVVNLWIGHHDELNKKKDKNRNWYSVSTGKIINFKFWASGEPNNLFGKEHCVHIYKSKDFKWNDRSCDYSYGYICERSTNCTEIPDEVTTVPCPGYPLLY
uniref:C-type lectin domain-containing protein n=1 Tax=Stomoxys calcitrans TaxID=35570 RepID=A0A1I8QEM4_STOCA